MPKRRASCGERGPGRVGTGKVSCAAGQVTGSSVTRASAGLAGRLRPRSVAGNELENWCRVRCCCCRYSYCPFQYKRICATASVPTGRSIASTPRQLRQGRHALPKPDGKPDQSAAHWAGAVRRTIHGHAPAAPLPEATVLSRINASSAVPAGALPQWPAPASHRALFAGIARHFHLFLAGVASFSRPVYLVPIDERRRV